MIRGQNLTKRFGALTAVNSVDISLTPGTIVGLVGPNGAGKSTLMNLLGGQWSVSDGEVWVDDRQITKWSVYKRVVNAGISRTFQTPRVFPSLSVRENILIGRHRSILGHLASDLLFSRTNQIETDSLVTDILERLQIQHVAEHPAGELPHGIKRWVELGRCLSATPRYLLLDEPAAGLTPTEVGQLADILRDLRARNLGILLVEHNLDLVASIADTMVVLEFGAVIARGVPKQVLQDERVRHAYLGG